MVQILPILAAATLLAQSAFGAAVPVKRTQYRESNNYQASNNNQYESNNRNQDSNQYAQNSNQYNQNQYQNNQYNQQNQEYNQDSNQYAQQNNQYENNQYQNNQYQNNQYQNNQYQNNQYEVTSTEAPMHEMTSTAQAYAVETTSVHEQQQSQEYNMPSYGSGSSNWNGYNDCVSQCMAQFGAPPSAVTMDSQSMPEAAGTGAVHTVMVAPDGVGLRYVPFAVNASIGDTIRYVWTTNANHTVTLSSALTICNKSALAEERNFISGIRNAASGTQTFDVVVETEEPQFFYCSVAQHCVKGMFGIVNPGSASSGSTNTVRNMMASILESNPQLQAANEYIRQNISNSDATSIQNWGNDISLDGYTQEQMAEVVSNVMFTRAVFGANPGMLDMNQGAATPDGSPIMIPQGLNVLLSNTNLNAPATSLSLTGTATGFPTPTGSGTIVAPLANGAFSAKGGASVWAAAFVGVLGYLLI